MQVFFYFRTICNSNGFFFHLTEANFKLTQCNFAQLSILVPTILSLSQVLVYNYISQFLFQVSSYSGISHCKIAGEWSKKPWNGNDEHPNGLSFQPLTMRRKTYFCKKSDGIKLRTQRYETKVCVWNTKSLPLYQFPANLLKDSFSVFF